MHRMKIFIDPQYVEEVSEWMEKHDYPPMREHKGHKFLSGASWGLG